MEGGWKEDNECSCGYVVFEVGLGETALSSGAQERG